MKLLISTLLLVAAVTANADSSRDSVALAQLRERVSKIAPGSALEVVKKTLGEPVSVSVSSNGNLELSFFVRETAGTRTFWVGIDADVTSDGRLLEAHPSDEGITQWISDAQFQSIVKGMTSSELIRFIGEPERRIDKGDTRQFSYTMRSCRQPEIDMQFVEIEILRNRVVSKRAFTR